MDKRISKRTRKHYIRCLDRYIANGVIRRNHRPSREKNWNRYAKAMRDLINFYTEKKLIPKDVSEELKSHLKTQSDGYDTYIPPDEEVRRVLESKIRHEGRILLHIFSKKRGLSLKYDRNWFVKQMRESLDPRIDNQIHDRSFIEERLHGQLPREVAQLDRSISKSDAGSP